MGVTDCDPTRLGSILSDLTRYEPTLSSGQLGCSTDSPLERPTASSTPTAGEKWHRFVTLTRAHRAVIGGTRHPPPPRHPPNLPTFSAAAPVRPLPHMRFYVIPPPPPPPTLIASRSMPFRIVINILHTSPVHRLARSSNPTSSLPSSFRRFRRTVPLPGRAAPAPLCLPGMPTLPRRRFRSPARGGGTGGRLVRPGTVEGGYRRVVLWMGV